MNSTLADSKVRRSARSFAAVSLVALGRSSARMVVTPNALLRARSSAL
jgi:hypothetical protein